MLDVSETRCEFLWGWGWGSKGRRAVGTVEGGKANIYLHSVYQKIIFFFLSFQLRPALFPNQSSARVRKLSFLRPVDREATRWPGQRRQAAEQIFKRREFVKTMRGATRGTLFSTASAATQPSRAEPSRAGRAGGRAGGSSTHFSVRTLFIWQTQQEFSGECFGEAKRRKEKRRLPVHMIQLKQQGMTFRSRTSGHWRNNNILDGNRMEK